MSFYWQEFYDMEIESKDRILQIVIEPSNRPPAICFEVHEMMNGAQKLFVRTGLNSTEFSKCLIDASNMLTKDNNDFDSPVYQKCVREIVNMKSPFTVYDLSVEESELIRKLCSEELPGEICRIGGLDGHHNIIKYNLHGEEKRYYCWSIIPKEWNYLYEVIMMCLSKMPVLPAGEAAYMPRREMDEDIIL